MVIIDSNKLLLISGPCQIESFEHSVAIATKLIELCKNKPITLVFKASYDKANRSSSSSVRGVGIDNGLEILSRVKKELNIPVLTDVHTPEEAFKAAEVVDIIQTPAFLCRQTDLLTACAKAALKYQRAINFKKGQFLSPHDVQFAIKKIQAIDTDIRLFLCERGSCFGYHDLVVDMRGLCIMKELGLPVVFDATHSVQSMGGATGVSGGSREFIFPLARAALACGVNGLFVETHENPSRAPSDGASMLPIELMDKFITQMLMIWSCSKDIV
jgi:2-dehydro-3-deoxyphosphooctonate aldolase (KDO 8-P synthase)